MKEIELTRGLVALVDDEDYEYLNQWNWQATTNRKSAQFYAKRDRLDGESYPASIIKMHRLILEYNHVDIAGLEVDHINNNGLDNRKSNLRVATGPQNHRNASKRRKSPSPYKGVFYLKKANRWMASLTYRGKSVYLGIYKTPEEARDAYDAGAKKYFGEFAKVNGPSGASCALDMSVLTLPKTASHCTRKRRNTKSAYRGVSADGNGWHVEIRFQGKRIYGGYYRTEIEAAKGYNEIMSKYYGDDFVQNKMPETQEI